MIHNAKDEQETAVAALTETSLPPRTAKGRPKGESKRTRLTHDQQDLAKKYLPMARSLAKPLKKAWPTQQDEFESAALLALVQAAQSFDPSRNVHFPTFARYRIWGALRDVQRGLITTGWKSDIENAPKITVICYDSEDHGRILMTQPDLPVGQEFEGNDFVEGCLRKLPTKHASACREIYMNGKTRAEAAQSLGCSKSRLCYLNKEGLKMIQDSWASLLKKDKHAAVPTRA